MSHLDRQKTRALVEWINALELGASITSLAGLSDGQLLQQIISNIDAEEASKQNGGGATATTSAWNLRVWCDMLAFLETRFQCGLTEHIDLQAIEQRADELEIAKVCLLVLSAGVLSGNSLFIDRAQKIEVMLQYEVKEMVESVGSSEDFESQGGGFYNVLTRSLDLGAQIQSPQMASTPQGTPAHQSTRALYTPGPTPAKIVAPINKGTPLLFSTSAQGNTSVLSKFMSPRVELGVNPRIPMSPIQQLVHSPNITNKILQQQKENEIRRLHRQLNEERHINMELDGDLKRAQLSIEQKEKQITDLQKEKSRFRRQTLDLQCDNDQLHGIRQEKEHLEEQVRRKEHLSRVVRELEDTKRALGRENDEAQALIAGQKSQLASLTKYRAATEPQLEMLNQMQVSQQEMKQRLEEQAGHVTRLSEENAVLRFDLLKVQESYQAKCDELRKHLETSMSFRSESGECLAGVAEVMHAEESRALRAEIAEMKAKLAQEDQEKQLMREKTDDQMQQHQNTISELQSTIVQLQSTINNQETALGTAKQEFEQHLAECTAKLTAMSTHELELKDDLVKSTQKCQQLESDLTQIKLDSDCNAKNLEEQIQKSMAKNEALTATVSELDSKRVQLEKSLTEKSQEVEEATRKFSSVLAELETSKSNLETQRGAFDTEMTQLKENADKEIALLKTEIEAARLHESQIRREFEERFHSEEQLQSEKQLQLEKEWKGKEWKFEERIVTLVAELEESRDECAKLKMRVESLQKDYGSSMQDLQCELEQANSFKDKLTEDVQSRIVACERLEQKNNTLETENSELRNQVHTLENVLKSDKELLVKEKQSLNIHNEELSQELARSGRENEQLVAKMAELQHENGVLQQCKADLGSQIETITNQCTESKKEIDSYKQDTETYRNQYEQLQREAQEENKARADEMQKLEKTLSETTEKLTLALSENEGASAIVTKLQTENDAVRKQLEGVVSTLHSRESDIQRYSEAAQTQLNDHNAKVNSLQSEFTQSLKSHTVQVHELETRLKSTSDALTGAKNERETLVSKVDNLQSQLEKTAALNGELDTKLQALLTGSTELNATVADLKNKNLQYEEQIQAQEKEIESKSANFDRELQSKDAAITETKHKRETYKAEIEAIKVENEALQQKCELQSSEYKQQVETKQSALSEATQKLKTFQSEIESLQTKISADNLNHEQEKHDLESSLARTTEQNAKLQQHIEQFTSKCCTFEEQVRLAKQASELEINRYKDDKEHAMAKYQQLQDRLKVTEDTKQSVVDNLTSAKDQLESQVAELDRNLCEEYAKCEALEQKMSVLKATSEKQIQHFESELKQADSRNCQLEQAVDSFQSKCHVFEEQIRSAQSNTQSKISDIETQLKSEHAKNSRLQDTVDAFSHKMDLLRSELEAKQKCYEENERIKNEYKGELSDTQRKMSDLTNELTSRKDKINSLETHLGEFCQKVEKMNQDYIKSHEEYARMEKSWQSAQIELRASVRENETTAAKLTQAHARIESLEAELSEAESVIGRMEEKISTYEDKVHNLETTLNQTSTQVEESFRVELKSAEDKNFELRSELDTAHATVSECQHKLLGLQAQLVKVHEAEQRAEGVVKDTKAELQRAHQKEKEMKKKYTQAQEKADTLESRLQKFKDEYGKMEEDYEHASKQLESHSTLQKKYDTLKASVVKFKGHMSEFEKREKQFCDVIDKYKSQESKNKETIGALQKQIEEGAERVGAYEQKWQQLDVEVSALKQQLHEHEHSNKSLSVENRSLKTQLEFATRELRELQRAPGSSSRTRHASSVNLDEARPAPRRKAVSSVDLQQPKLEMKSSVITREASKARIRSLSSASSQASSADEDVLDGEMCLDDLHGQGHEFAAPRPITSARETRLSSSSSTGSMYETSRQTVRQSVRQSTGRLTRSSVSASFQPTRATAVPCGFGALLSQDCEPDIMLESDFGRLSEMQRRNTLCLPHMKSSYPVETQVASTDALGEAHIQQGTPVEHMLQSPQETRRRGRKRLSTELLDGRDSLEAIGTDKRQAKERRLDGRVIELGTPGVKLYKQYSPHTRSRLKQQEKATPGRKFSTDNLKSAIEEVESDSPARNLRSSASVSGLRHNDVTSTLNTVTSSSMTSLRGSRGQTPSASQSSLSKLRKWARNNTPRGNRRTPRKSVKSSSDENEGTESKSLKKSLTFSISNTPKKKFSRLVLKDLPQKSSSRRGDTSSGSKVSKKPLGENNQAF